MSTKIPYNYLRLRDIIGDRSKGISPIIPVSKSTWWAGVRSGRFPQPTRAFGKRITAWRCEDIVDYLRTTSAK